MWTAQRLWRLQWLRLWSIPTFHTQLAAGMNFDAEIKAEGDHCWFSFTPQEDGEYIFLSEAKVGTKSRSLDSASEDQQLTELAVSKGYNRNNIRNFRLSYSLSKGVTYFYRVGFLSKYDSWYVSGKGFQKFRRLSDNRCCFKYRECS